MFRRRRCVLERGVAGDVSHCWRLAFASFGCTSSELPPAKEGDTPKMDEDGKDLHKQGMPEDAKEQMRKNGYE
jgi:hypothetical protein